MKRNQQIKIEIKDGRLNISVGIDMLCHSRTLNVEDFRITNNDMFAKDIRNELLSEEEDGTTLLHKAFDEAANLAIDNGSEHVEVK